MQNTEASAPERFDPAHFTFHFSLCTLHFFHYSPPMSLKQDLQFAIELARGASEIVLSHFGKVERLTKTHIAASAEAVTEADRASQRYIISGIRRRFATDGIVGEESETGTSITFDCPDPNGRAWVIDPIDGTNNFVAGLGNFAVCIGLIERGMPVLGVVLDVTRDLVYSAAAGEGAWLGNQRLHARTTPLDHSSMLMLTSNLLDSHGRCPAWAGRFIGQTDWKVRMLGSAALEAIQVAAGVAHGCFTVNGKLWDIAAPAAVLLEAGAVITDLTGRGIFPYNLVNYQGAKVPFLAAGPGAHGELLREVLAHP
jgi:fructose-1,6-bisphosphatase/inositol monophosphatase family enzyme